jgi:hypothetical protein
VVFLKREMFSKKCMMKGIHPYHQKKWEGLGTPWFRGGPQVLAQSG